MESLSMFSDLSPTDWLLIFWDIVPLFAAPREDGMGHVHLLVLFP